MQSGEHTSTLLNNPSIGVLTKDSILLNLLTQDAIHLTLLAKNFKRSTIAAGLVLQKNETPT